jgi:Ubiquitin-like autophagy protein Apg12
MTDNIPDESPSSVPPNLSSSIILSALPRDATAALTQAAVTPKKRGITILFKANDVVTVRFKGVGGAPILVEAMQRGQIGSDQKFGTILNHLRRHLKIKSSESIVLPQTSFVDLVSLCQLKLCANFRRNRRQLIRSISHSVHSNKSVSTFKEN